ncbi:hypothetical protein Tsubulata_009139 [Turnera subulata]|uniref:Uncharacterized protein n=1 Tax=Turnera subulata TaxID=218843 RepID=A0A9Q0JMG2_9ROSI|nr:hypothetical protein Tsubulata_009139 [Turnera subulata]
MSVFKALIFKISQNVILEDSKWKLSSVSSRMIRTLASSSSSSSSSTYYSLSQPKNQNEPNAKKPLHLLFQEAVGLVSPEEIVESPSLDSAQTQTNQLVNTKLRELEEEVRALMRREAAGAPVSVKEEHTRKTLYSVFAHTPPEAEKKQKKKKKKEEGPGVFKDLSPDMEMFLTHLYRMGYLREANFLGESGKLDFSCFNDSYSRSFIMFAAHKFGQDHQDIAKWVSGSDLKKVALFGCPSLSRKSVISAKMLRRYFDIQEDSVCGKCVLKDSCSLANKGISNAKTLSLGAVMRVITLYALEMVNPKLLVPDEIKRSVSRLLGEVVRLSKSTN